MRISDWSSDVCSSDLEPLHAFALQRPGTARSTGHFTTHETVDRFAHARGCRVRGRGHITMMTSVVLDEKMAVAGRCQDQFRQRLLQPRTFVAQLVPDVDAKATDDAGSQGDCQQAVPR